MKNRVPCFADTTKKERALQVRQNQIFLRKFVIYSLLASVIFVLLFEDVRAIQEGKFSFITSRLLHIVGFVTVMFAIFVFDVNYSIPYVQYCLS